MNVLSRTLAVRSASTCLAATSATVRKATRSTLWARHARLSQVTFERLPYSELTLKSRCLVWQFRDCMTYRFVTPSPLFSSASSRHCAHAVLHQQTRGEEDDGGPQRVCPSDPPAEECSGSGHWHAKQNDLLVWPVSEENLQVRNTLKLYRSVSGWFSRGLSARSYHKTWLHQKACIYNSVLHLTRCQSR